MSDPRTTYYRAELIIERHEPVRNPMGTSEYELGLADVEIISTDSAYDAVTQLMSHATMLRNRFAKDLPAEPGEDFGLPMAAKDGDSATLSGVRFVYRDEEWKEALAPLGTQDRTSLVPLIPANPTNQRIVPAPRSAVPPPSGGDEPVGR